jgi:hypothetical protein
MDASMGEDIDHDERFNRPLPHASPCRATGGFFAFEIAKPRQ